MKKFSTVYLLAAIVMLGSCARDYATYKHAPNSAYLGSRTETPAVAKVAPTEVEETPVFEALSSNPEVAKMLAESSPRQIDEQLEKALATTEGQKLMAKPLIAAQITKAREVIAKNELRNAPGSEVATSKVSKLVNSTLKKHVEKSTTVAPESTKAAKALNGKIKTGLILLVAGIVLAVIPGLGWYIGGIVSTIGVIFIVLGLLESV